MKLLILMAVLFAAPAWAQKDAMKVDEKLSVAVVKKSDSKAVTPAKGLAEPKPVKAGETLEIETRREVKK